MAKIKVLENVVFITSEVKADQLAKVSNLKPAALDLMTGEGSSKTIDFKVDPSTSSVVSNNGSLSKYGVKFYETEENELKVRVDLGDIKKEARLDYIKENFTYPLLKLAKVEQQIIAAISTIDTEFGNLEREIEILE